MFQSRLQSDHFNDEAPGYQEKTPTYPAEMNRQHPNKVGGKDKHKKECAISDHRLQEV
jgi:hypothetical protein